MKNTDIAFIISDSKHNIAILSGINDDENSWSEYCGEFVNNNINNISLNMQDSKYDYSILLRNDFKIRITSSDLQVELSEQIELHALIDTLLSECDVIIHSNIDGVRQFVFNINGVDITVYKTTVHLMRGVREFLHIVL